MDHFNQDDLLKLKSLLKEVNWGIEEQRVELLHRVINLFNEWNGQLPNLLDVFRSDEIDWLISEVVSKHMTGRGEDISRPKGLIDFVISTGYKNKPLVDEDGKPALNRTTPLHHAARNIRGFKLRRVIGKLFKIYNRIDVNYIDDSGRTHFHVACMSGHYDVVKGFLDFGQDPNQLLTETGDSSLLLALQNCDCISECNKVIELLLRRGADPNLTDKFGWAPFHWICEDQNIDAAKMLFEMCDEKHVPVQVNVQDKFDRTPLHIALVHSSRTLMKILLRRGADPHVADEKGDTALHYICIEDHVNRLLQKFFKICDGIGHKVQVNVRNKMDQTPLHTSLDHHNRHLVEFLLRRGADPNVVDKYGLAPLHIILKSKTSLTPNEDDFVEVFFNINDEIQQTVQVDVQDHEGKTPLLYALLWKCRKTAEYLLRRGAKPGLADKNRSTPLHFLSEMNGSIDLVKMLFEFSKDEIWWSSEKVNVNAIDKWGRTPLHLALLSNNKKVAKLLLKKGADPILATEKGSTPLHLMSKTYYDNYDLVNNLFKISNKKNQLVQVDARDSKGLTPLQWAVANFLPGVVDALMDHGADLSSFVFPDSILFKESFTLHRIEEFKLMSTSRAMSIVQCLEKRGYVVDRSDAINIMKFFIEQGLFAKSADVKINWDDEQEFVKKTKEVMINSSLSLYDLIRLRPEEAVKLLACADCLAFSHSVDLSKLPRGPKAACTAHLCELMSRRFFRRWALESFWKLIWYRLPIECCEMIMEPLMNEDLYNICLADQNQCLKGNIFM
uniref:Uncharacterized protein n=1 Tax=Trichogramma kaykai TaxID=54128 RepID=A0ABD2VSK9_9HYME